MVDLTKALLEKVSLCILIVGILILDAIIVITIRLVYWAIKFVSILTGSGSEHFYLLDQITDIGSIVLYVVWALFGIWYCIKHLLDDITEWINKRREVIDREPQN
jgi:hypothetical protein